MINKITVITGAGTGIGRALAVCLADKKNLKILGIGRRPGPLKELKKLYPDKIDIISADVGDEEGREKIYQKILPDSQIQFLIHNAAVLEPVKPIMEISLNEWRTHQSINVEAPIFLTQKLLPFLSAGSRILHISSGAAHSGYAGWGAYCASKAALYLVYEVLREELKQKNIFVGSVRPGVVDTPMQDLVRTFSESVFPMLKKFQKLKKEKQLVAPDQVSEFLVSLLLETKDEEFTKAEWDYRDFLDGIKTV